jgi:hypothetical protein
MLEFFRLLLAMYVLWCISLDADIAFLAVVGVPVFLSFSLESDARNQFRKALDFLLTIALASLAAVVVLAVQNESHFAWWWYYPAVFFAYYSVLTRGIHTSKAAIPAGCVCFILACVWWSSLDKSVFAESGGAHLVNWFLSGWWDSGWGGVSLSFLVLWLGQWLFGVAFMLPAMAIGRLVARRTSSIRSTSGIAVAAKRAA